MSGPLVTQKPNTDERCATLKLYPLSAHPHQTAWIHPWVCPDTTQLGPHKTHNMPPCRARQTPACLPISSETSPLGPMENPRGGGAGPDTKKGTMANVKAGWLLQGEAQLLLSEGKSGGWHPKAAPFLSSKDTQYTMVKWPNSTHINKQTNKCFGFETIESPRSNYLKYTLRRNRSI